MVVICGNLKMGVCSLVLFRKIKTGFFFFVFKKRLIGFVDCFGVLFNPLFDCSSHKKEKKMKLKSCCVL